MRYIPVTDEATASALSRAIYRLARTAAEVPADEDDSQMTYTYWVSHPTTGEVRMAFVDDDIPQAYTTISLLADENSLTPFLQPYVTNNSIPSSVLNNVRDGIIASKGVWTHIYNFLPDFWKNASISQEQMSSAGWFS
ncbi:MAG: hypothetical protein V7L23_15230 [Nostoc sp.]|uniref:hypothetical protein n=1 Tax=Nostoc sp. TaxID=1180 RepID=UPI002FEFE36B